MSTQPEPGKSTGPRTAAGKAVSRNNAFKHGMRSRTVIMLGEDPGENAALLNDIVEDFKPSTKHEHWLLKQMADARWRLERLKGIETALLSEDDIDTEELDRNSRWQMRMEQSYYRAYTRLQAFQESDDVSRPQSPVRLCWVDPTTGEKEYFGPPDDPEDPASRR